MRFTTFVAAASACMAPVTAVSILNGKAYNLLGDDGDDDYKIPGDSPLEFCPGDHVADLIHIDKIDLSPNPPRAGTQLEIKAKGTVKEKIEDGAYVLLTVKYGLIRLISTKADLCNQITNIDLECPVEAGDLELSKVVDLPAEIPPGKYTVVADAYTVDGVQITCLTATVQFSTGGGFFGSDL